MPRRMSGKFILLGDTRDVHVGPHVKISRPPWPVIDVNGSVVILEPQVVLSSGVYIHTHSHQFQRADWRDLPKVENRTPTVIGEKAFLGVNSQILHTCKYIGKCSVVAAGSIVTCDIPDYEIWAGNPARKIGDVHGKEMDSESHQETRSPARAAERQAGA